MKLPAFQFYPGDWRKDPGVQSLNFHDRGIWLEIICLMHESEERGKLMLNGSPMPEDALARLLGLDKQNLTTTLTTILTYGVASTCEETGSLICRRMVRDEYIRKVRAEAGKLGGNPALLKQKSTTLLKQKTTPSSSSSSSFSSSEVIPPNPQGGDFVFDEELQISEKPSTEILPSGWNRMTRSEQGRKKVHRNTPLMIRIGKFFGQRESTLWTIADYIALEDVQPSEDDLDLIEAHYSLELENNGYRITCIQTLLNQWPKARSKAAIYFSENPTHR